MENKYYKWDPEVEITIKGKEFDILFNTVSAFMNSVLSPRSILAIADSEITLKQVLLRMIENGQATEEASPMSISASESATGDPAEGTLTTKESIPTPGAEN